MKKLTTTLVLLIGLSITIGYAQENLIKTGLTNALLGDFNLSYERVLNTKSSAQIKIGYWTPTLSPFVSKGLLTPNEYNLQNFAGGISTSVEYRFFLKENSIPKGFYLAPYLRYFNQKALFDDYIKGDLFNVDVRVNTFGLGGQMGYQLILKNNLTFDFYFIGMGVDKYSSKIIYTLDKPVSSFNYATITDDVHESFDDYKFFQKRLKHSVNKNNHLTKLPFFFPGIRVGISLGIAF